MGHMLLKDRKSTFNSFHIKHNDVFSPLHCAVHGIFLLSSRNAIIANIIYIKLKIKTYPMFRDYPTTLEMDLTKGSSLFSLYFVKNVAVEHFFKM